MAAPRNVAHRAFIEHLKTLETEITDPEGLASALYSKALIDRLAWHTASNRSATKLERSRELLQKLEVKIQEDEGAFYTFLSILDPDPTKEDICRDLRATRGQPSSAIISPRYPPFLSQMSLPMSLQGKRRVSAMTHRVILEAVQPGLHIGRYSLEYRSYLSQWLPYCGLT